MKLLFILIFIFSCSNNDTVEKREITVDLFGLMGENIGKKFGTITITEKEDGISFYVIAKDLIPGDHGFHLHEYASLEPDKTGIHWDPDNTGKHKGPYSKEGHRGDLPFLTVENDGTIEQEVIAPNIVFDDVMNKSIMIHEGPDNYTDNPVNGGGGDKIFGSIVLVE